jgi:hypothetical protein
MYCHVSCRLSQLPTWLPSWLLVHLAALISFLQSCWELLPGFVSPSFPEALRRLVLVLGASVASIILVCTIDSAWLYLYLINARRAVLPA